MSLSDIICSSRLYLEYISLTNVYASISILLLLYHGIKYPNFINLLYITNI